MLVPAKNMAFLYPCDHFSIALIWLIASSQSDGNGEACSDKMLALTGWIKNILMALRVK